MIGFERIKRSTSAKYAYVNASQRRQRSPPVWWWLAAGVATALLAGYELVGYLATRTGDAFAEALSGVPGGAGPLDGCCERPPTGSRVERANRPVAAIVQVGAAPPGHLMLLAPRFERGAVRPDTTLVGRLALVEPNGAALVIGLVPRDSVLDRAPAATLVLGPKRRLVAVYRR